jgi:hypothetical protein
MMALEGGATPCERGNPVASCIYDPAYRGTSIIKNSASLGPYSRNMPMATWWPYGGELFLMSEMPL